jgi:large subunit ribosomal protein L30
MAKENQTTLKIRWIRSGIAFNRHQEQVVRSLGLRRLHHVVERPDNAVVRGLIAKVSHLVEVVEATKPSVWASVPAYTILRPEAPTEVASSEGDAQAAAGQAGDTTPQASGAPETEEKSSAPEPEAATSQPRRKSRGRKV